MKLIIKDDDERSTVVPIVRDEYSIGRGEKNNIRLTERNISRRHARILRDKGAIYIEDLGSYNGVRVNGERISSKSRLQDGDIVAIGDYSIELHGTGEEAGEETPSSPGLEATLPPPTRPAPSSATL